MKIQFRDGLGNGMDITGWTVVAQVWDKRRQTQYGEFSVEVIEAPEGIATLTLPHTVTEVLPREARYDVMLIDPHGLREYYLEGVVRPSEGFSTPD